MQMVRALLCFVVIMVSIHVDLIDIFTHISQVATKTRMVAFVPVKLPWGIWVKSIVSWFNVDMSCYRYRKSHCRAKAVVIWSYLHNGIFYCGKIVSLCWIVPLVTNYYKTHPSMNIDYNSRIFPNWKPKVVLKPTLSSLVAPAFVITTTAAPTSDHQVGIITTLGCQCM